MKENKLKKNETCLKNYEKYLNDRTIWLIGNYGNRNFLKFLSLNISELSLYVRDEYYNNKPFGYVLFIEVEDTYNNKKLINLVNGTMDTVGWYDLTTMEKAKIVDYLEETYIGVDKLKEYQIPEVLYRGLDRLSDMMQELIKEAEKWNCYLKGKTDEFINLLGGSDKIGNQ